MIANDKPVNGVMSDAEWERVAPGLFAKIADGKRQSRQRYWNTVQRYIKAFNRWDYKNGGHSPRALSGFAAYCWLYRHKFNRQEAA